MGIQHRMGQEQLCMATSKTSLKQSTCRTQNPCVISGTALDFRLSTEDENRCITQIRCKNLDIPGEGEAEDGIEMKQEEMNCRNSLFA